MALLTKWQLFLPGTLCLLLAAWCAPAQAAERVVLQLKWTHAFQFAGYYAAQEKGFYREAGLNVDLKEAHPGTDVVDEVTRGKAQFGVGNSSLILAHHARKPVVVLAVIFQHSPLVLVAAKKGSSDSIHDLAGKKIMLEDQSDELLAYLKQEGLSTDRFVSVPHDFGCQRLITGKVDAMSAYSTYELFDLDRTGFPYSIYPPRSAGIDFYGDNLFTSENELARHPKLVRAMRSASLKGWHYALQHPDEIARLIYDRYSKANTLELYQYEAAHMLPLIQPDLVEIGYMHPGRWRRIAKIYADLKLLPRDYSLKGFLYDPDPDPDIDLHRYYGYLAAAFAIVLFTSCLAIYVSGVNRRLTREMHTRKTLEGKLRSLSVAVEQSPVSVVITDLQGTMEYVNPMFSKVTGYSSAEVIGKHTRMLNSGLTEMEVFTDLWSTITRGKNWCGEFIDRRKNGELFWEEAHISPVFDSTGKPVQYVAVKLDITGRKEVERRISHMALHDSLTDLPNRSLFSELLKQAMELAVRRGGPLALMFLDLDHFKEVNDTYGHAVGDLLLKQAADRMSSCLRHSDKLGRIGGDEFVVLLSGIEQQSDALPVAEKLRQTLALPFEMQGVTLCITASIGIALYPEHGDNETELARHADRAMYHAKQEGRNRAVLFSAEIAAEQDPS